MQVKIKKHEQTLGLSQMSKTQQRSDIARAYTVKLSAQLR